MLFYNDQQAQIPWQGLPPMARPSPQGQSQVYSGLPATATANTPVAPPMPVGGDKMGIRKPFWSGLPMPGPARQYGH